MTLWQPRHRRPSKIPLYLRLGSLALIPALTVGAIVVLNDDPSSSGTLRVETESTRTSDWPGDVTSSGATGTTSPTGSVTGTPGESATPDAGTDPIVDGTDRADDGSRGESSPTGDPDTTRDPDPSGDPDPTDDADPAEPETPDTPDSPRPSPTPTTEPTRPGQPTPTNEPTRPTDPTPTPSEKPTDPRPTAPVLSRDEQAVIDATNAARAEAGCTPLRVDGRLLAAAREHSLDMRKRWFVSHVNPDGETPADRASDHGYDGSVTENIWRGTRSAERVVKRWMSDSDSRARLLDCSYTSVGVGVEKGLLLNAWWSQLLGRD